MIKLMTSSWVYLLLLTGSPDETGKIIPAAEGIYPSSPFYKGSATHYFPNNSNVWAARALKGAGFSIRPIWCQTTESVLKKAARIRELVVEKGKYQKPPNTPPVFEL